MELSAGESGRTEHLLSRISLSGGDDRRTDPRKGVFRMLDYEEELKKFKPSLEVEDIEDAVSAYKQELITNGLDDEHSGGSKAASEKQIDEAADSLLESITVK